MQRHARKFRLFRLRRAIRLNGCATGDAGLVRELCDSGTSLSRSLSDAFHSTVRMSPQNDGETTVAPRGCMHGAFSLDGTPTCYSAPRAWPCTWCMAVFFFLCGARTA